MRSSKLSLVAPLVLLCACGGEVAHSEPVSLKLSGIKEGDLKNEAFNEEKGVSTESGNPYQRFLENAKAALDGNAPGAIEVDEVILSVSADSKGVGSGGFSEIISNVEVFLADDKTTVSVGSLSELEVGNTITVPVSATSESLAAIKPSLLNGSFKVGIRGDASGSRPANDFELKTNVQITFRALE